MDETHTDRHAKAETLAKQRFAILAMLRLSGVAIALLGLLLLGERLSFGNSTIDRVAGALFVILGTFDVLIIPAWLARRWKSSGKQ